MKPFDLPAITLGLDVVSPEGALPKGAVRRATNVQLLDDGSFQRRPGHEPQIELENAHSFWRSPAQTRVLCAAGTTLYDVSLAAGTATPLFTGLQTDQPVSYQDVGPDIVFVSHGVHLRIAPDSTITRPGVADLMGVAPTLDETLGGLLPGRYGVAYSLLTARGEESPISSISWIDLATGGGIVLTDIQGATDATRVKLYVTSANGETLYHHGTRAWADTASIVDQTRKKEASRQYKVPMPPGTIVRLFNGRLFVVDGKWVTVSDPLDYGITDVKSGWITFNRTITMFEPVEGGIFVGLRERTIFLRADGDKWVQIPVSDHGALSRSKKVAASLFSPELAPTRDKPVAVWLSEVGLAIGRPDGSVFYPQADRIRLSGDASEPMFALHGGISQGVFCVESMTTGAGGAVDRTI